VGILFVKVCVLVLYVCAACMCMCVFLFVDVLTSACVFTCCLHVQTHACSLAFVQQYVSLCVHVEDADHSLDGGDTLLHQACLAMGLATPVAHGPLLALRNHLRQILS